MFTLVLNRDATDTKKSFGKLLNDFKIQAFTTIWFIKNYNS